MSYASTRVKLNCGLGILSWLVVFSFFSLRSNLKFDSVKANEDMIFVNTRFLFWRLFCGIPLLMQFLLEFCPMPFLIFSISSVSCTLVFLLILFELWMSLKYSFPVFLIFDVFLSQDVQKRVKNFSKQIFFTTICLTLVENFEFIQLQFSL